MEQPIRILCVFSTLNRGGAESMCMNLYRNIDRSKVQFDFVKHTPEIGAFEEEIVALGGRIYEAPRYKIYNHLSYCAWWKKHLSQHPEHQIIHGHFFTTSAVYFHVAKKLGRITIGHSHASENEHPKGKERIKRILESKVERYSDYCFACGQQAGQWLFPHKQFTVLNNALDTGQYCYNPTVREEVRKEFGMTDDCLVMGTVGNIAAVKNPFGAVDIFEAIHKRNQRARFLWVGGNNSSINESVKKVLSEKKLDDCVIQTGARNDVCRLLQAMDAFILPSFSEGLPVVAIEAQAAGLQCFISDRVTEECDITGRCRFLSIDQPELWADEILSANLSRTDTTQQIIDAGYDIRTTAKWLESFYLNLASNRS